MNYTDRRRPGAHLHTHTKPERKKEPKFDKGHFNDVKKYHSLVHYAVQTAATTFARDGTKRNTTTRKEEAQLLIRVIFKPRFRQTAIYRTALKYSWSQSSTSHTDTQMVWMKLIRRGSGTARRARDMRHWSKRRKTTNFGCAYFSKLAHTCSLLVHTIGSSGVFSYP